MRDHYPLYVHWETTLKWILERIDRFPKSVRFSLSSRIANISLDILEAIVEAIYSRERISILDRINLHLEKLRILFRICHSRQYLSLRQFEYVSKSIDEAGRMTGGWRKAHA